MGMADSLIHRLSSMKTFFIRPLSATRKYEDLAQDPLVAGREQRVDYVIAANYQLADGKIRVTVQLFNVASGQVEETRLIEKQMDNIFATQDAIGSEVGKLLQIHFATSGLPAGVRRGTTSEEAYRFYLQGKYLAMKRNPRDAAKAVEYLDQALRLDPNFALAYAQKAHAYRKINKDSREVEIQTVKNLIAKALALDSNLAEAYAVRADSALLYEWEFPAVERDVLHAIELEPNNDMAHWVYALLLAMRGRLSEALIEIETCQAIDPGAAVYMRDRGRILYLARRYDEAIAELERGVALDEQMGIGWLRLAYAAKGDDARTYEIFIKNQKRMNPDLVAAYEQAYETAGWDGIRRKILENFKLSEKLTGAGFAMMAGVAARLGEKDLAFDYLNKAVETRDWWALHMKNDPELDPLRDDPRFNEVLRRAGLN
jgi:tetratricopeptide (TPR) repeat protein